MKNLDMEGKNQEKEDKMWRKGKNWEDAFTLPGLAKLLADNKSIVHEFFKKEVFINQCKNFYLQNLHSFRNKQA